VALKYYILQDIIEPIYSTDIAPVPVLYILKVYGTHCHSGLDGRIYELNDKTVGA